MNEYVSGAKGHRDLKKTRSMLGTTCRTSLEVSDALGAAGSKAVNERMGNNSGLLIQDGPGVSFDCTLTLNQR